MSVMIATGTACSHDVEIEYVRAWTLRILENAKYLHAKQLRGLIGHKSRYVFTRDMDEATFLHGVYIGLCDHFNAGCEIENMSEESCKLLNLPFYCEDKNT